MTVQLKLPGGITLGVDRAQAAALGAQIATLGLQQSTTTQPSSGGGPAIPDDHPIWEQHSGGDPHSVAPEWSSDDLPLAEAFYAGLKGKALTFFDILIDNPGQTLTVDDISALAPKNVLPNKFSIAGSISGLRKAHEQSGRRYPFYWWEGAPAKYAMKLGVALLFSRARENSSPMFELQDAERQPIATSVNAERAGSNGAFRATVLLRIKNRGSIAAENVEVELRVRERSEDYSSKITDIGTPDHVHATVLPSGSIQRVRRIAPGKHQTLQPIEISGPEDFKAHIADIEYRITSEVSKPVVGAFTVHR